MQPGGDAGGHATAADLQKGCVKRAMAGEDDFVCQRALACHDVQIVIGMDINRPAGAFIVAGCGDGLIVTITGQDNFYPATTVVAHRLLFDSRCRSRHKDPGVDAESLRC